MPKIIIWIIVILVAIAAGFFIFSGKDSQQENVDTENNNVVSATDWRQIEVEDVLTGENFKISDFKGTPVLLESFAVWCPTCLKQLKETKKLKQEEGDSIIHIALDTDPNEDAEKVRQHAENNDLDWFFVVSPVELTRSLIKEFGQGVVSAPSVPVVLICEDQSARLLKRGIKTPSELKLEVEKGC